MDTNLSVIISQLQAVIAEIRAYVPINPLYAQSVAAYMQTAGDNCDQAYEKISLAQIEETGSFQVPGPFGN